MQLGLIYPCLLGARMLGSTAFPWFFSGPLYLRTEDCLVYVFIVMGFVLSIVAYDYQVSKLLIMIIWRTPFLVLFSINIWILTIAPELYCLYFVCRKLEFL